MSDRFRGNPGSLDTGYLTELGLLRHAPKDTGGSEPQRWPVDVYLEDCVLGGVVESMQRRLGDHLRAVDDLLQLEGAVVRSLKTGADLTKPRSAIVTTHNILFVVDCSEVPAEDRHNGLHVEKRTHLVTANVGPYWARGRAHLPPAGDMHNYIRGASGSFIPLTEVTISGHEQHNGKTMLLNRAHLRCLLL